jgi:steroid 5-alpha reductase family enzyme
MSAWTAAALGLLLMAAWMGTLYAVGRRMSNAGIVDFGWTLGIPILATLFALVLPGWGPRRRLAAVAAALWGLRLGLYLLFTRVLGHPEEGRYVQLRKEWGTRAEIKLFFFFQFQGLLDLFFALPFLLMSRNPAAAFHPLEGAGAAVWFLGWIGEAAADLQLHRFKQAPANRGKTCRAGLWRYSRHPNYFFEALLWCGFALMATPSPFGVSAWLVPALLLYFLFRVTGIPATEAQALRTRGEDYADYIRTTSAFVPWFPRRREKG